MTIWVPEETTSVTGEVADVVKERSHVGKPAESVLASVLKGLVLPVHTTIQEVDSESLILCLSTAVEPFVVLGLVSSATISFGVISLVPFGEIAPSTFGRPCDNDTIIFERR